MALHFPGEESPRVGLMVRWAGSTYDVLPPAALTRVREIVEELHGLGVVHRDLACRNMSYDPKSGRVMVFDFSEGGTREMFGGGGEEEFSWACSEDLRWLDEEMDYVTAHPESCRYYF